VVDWVATGGDAFYARQGQKGQGPEKKNFQNYFGWFASPLIGRDFCWNKNSV
jgi:hypothetical protein